MPRTKDTSNKYIDKRNRNLNDFPFQWNETSGQSPIKFIEDWSKNCVRCIVFVWDFEVPPIQGNYFPIPDSMAKHNNWDSTRTYLSFRPTSGLDSNENLVLLFGDWVLKYYVKKLETEDEKKLQLNLSEIKKMVYLIRNLVPDVNGIHFEIYRARENGSAKRIRFANHKDMQCGLLSDHYKTWANAMATFWEELQKVADHLESVFLQSKGFKLKKGKLSAYKIWLEEGLDLLDWNDPNSKLSEETLIAILNRLVRGKIK